MDNTCQDKLSEYRPDTLNQHVVSRCVGHAIIGRNDRVRYHDEVEGEEDYFTTTRHKLTVPQRKNYLLVFETSVNYI